MSFELNLFYPVSVFCSKIINSSEIGLMIFLPCRALSMSFCWSIYVWPAVWYYRVDQNKPDLFER